MGRAPVDHKPSHPHQKSAQKESQKSPQKVEEKNQIGTMGPVDHKLAFISFLFLVENLKI